MLVLKNFIFTILVPGTVAVYVPLWLSSPSTPATGLIIFAAGITLVALGAAIYFWCLWDFASLGRGTPAPIDPPKVLVARGLYRYTRNPMYVGVLTTIVGWAVLFASLALAVYAACVAACFHLFVLFYEEPRLRKSFGANYEEYCRSVGRWLWPV